MAVSVVGATCKCPFGSVCPIVVLPTTNVFISGRQCVRMPNAQAIVNIPSFGMCNNPGNPAVIEIPPGIIIPTACIPNITNPNWLTKKFNVKVCGQPVCSDGDMCMCSYGGIITIETSGQFSVS